MIKHYKDFFLIAITTLGILSTTGFAKQQPFDITNLINTIPFGELLENDEITSENLLHLINNKQKQSNPNPYRWILEKRDKTTIIFYNENERWVLHTYPMKENKKLLLVNTQLGNHHQTQNFSFFIYNINTRNLSKKIKSDIFVPEVIKENEFLTNEQKFPESAEGNATLYMDDDGTIIAAPWTWMESRWEHKEPQYKIKFIWSKDKNTFIKIKEKI